MKRLLSFLSVGQISLLPVLSVVSCSSNENYKEFKKWIDNKESFVLYIGSSDEKSSTTFETLLDTKLDSNGTTGLDLLKNSLNTFKDAYNEKYNSEYQKNRDDKLKNALGITQQINSIDFHQFKTSETTNGWTEDKWIKNINSWIVDQDTEILNNSFVGTSKEVTSSQKELLKKSVSSNAFPMFLVIRNGQLLSIVTGVPTTTSKDDWQVFFNTNFSILANEEYNGKKWGNINDGDIDSQYDNLINNLTDIINKSSDSSSDGSNTLTSYNYDNVNLKKYL